MSFAVGFGGLVQYDNDNSESSGDETQEEPSAAVAPVTAARVAAGQSRPATRFLAELIFDSCVCRAQTTLPGGSRSGIRQMVHSVSRAATRVLFVDVNVPSRDRNERRRDAEAEGREATGHGHEAGRLPRREFRLRLFPCSHVVHCIPCARQFGAVSTWRRSTQNITQVLNARRWYLQTQLRI